MPIYEFYCPDCNVIFNFLSRTANPSARPKCPRCRGGRLSREISAFAVTGRAKEGGDALDDLPIDEGKMENALMKLAGEAENIREDDPKDAARLMRKFSSMTGLEYGKGIEEALHRMEAGEDPDKIESEMGDLMEGDEEPFVLPGRKAGGGHGGRARPAPGRDPKLYDM